MAIGRTNAGGSGGAGLNFKVICNPQPSTAKENTIWVDTDKINNYYFSATQPENMVDYDVWIITGTSSTVAFSATKKNPVMVYPLSAKQYVSGALVDKTAKSWQGGEWVDWGMYLYKDGNVNTDLIGNFKAYAYGYSGWSSTKKAPTITQGTNTIDLTLAGVASGANFTSQGIVAPEKAIDVSNFGTLKVHITEYSGEERSARIGCLSSIRDNFTFVDDTFSIIAGTGDTTLDISGISGAIYPIILLSGEGDKSLSLDEWSLEV